MKPISHFACGLTLTFGIAACVPAPRPAPPVQARAGLRPAPVAVPTPAPVYDSWMDAPQTPGDWRYERVDGGSLARFERTAGEGQFGIGCMANSRRIVLIRYGGQGGAEASMTVRTETATRTLPIKPAISQDGVSAALPASDRLLDAMALSKGRFAVEVAGAPTLYLPSWAEVTRVIEDCR